MSEGESASVRVWAAFAGWALVGTLLTFGLASLLLPILVMCLLAAGVVVSILLRETLRARGQWVGISGLGLGAALLLAYVGWLNRGGPGTVCVYDHSGGSTCTEEWAPWPFYLVAALLVITSFVLFAYLRRAERARRVRVARL